MPDSYSMICTIRKLRIRKIYVTVRVQQSGLRVFDGKTRTANQAIRNSSHFRDVPRFHFGEQFVLAFNFDRQQEALRIDEDDYYLERD